VGGIEEGGKWEGGKREGEQRQGVGFWWLLRRRLLGERAPLLTAVDWPDACMRACVSPFLLTLPWLPCALPAGGRWRSGLRVPQELCPHGGGLR
jgi:hypothetical protein